MSSEQRASWSVALASNPKRGDMSVSTKTYPLILAMEAGGLTIAWTGTAVGTIDILFSNDYKILDQTDFWNGHWDAIDAALSAPPPDPAGVAGQATISLAPLTARWVRVDFTRVSGSGGIEVTLATPSRG